MLKWTLPLLLLAFSSSAAAQTTVTGTIHDLQGNPYANGTASAFLAVVSGQTQPPSTNVTTTAGGFFTMTLNAGSYAFTLCAPPVARPPIAPTNNPSPTQICFSSAPIVISGGSQDVSANLNSIAASLGVQGTSAGGVTNPASLNNIIFVDGVTNTTVTLACAKNPGGEVILPSGTLKPTAQISCSTPTNIEGVGKQQTIIQPQSSACASLGSYLFNLTGQAEGNRIAKMTIDLTNCPAVGVADFTNITHPYVQDVRVIYADGTPGTGTTFNFSNTPEPHFNNVNLRSPGTAFSIGETVAEQFFTDVVVECPLLGLNVQRTTATDVGAIYFSTFKVTNPCNRNPSKGATLNSSASNSSYPMFFVDSVFDNTLGSDTFTDTNINQIRMVDSWFTNGDALGSNHTAITLSGVTEFTSIADYLKSNWCDLKYANTNASIRFISTKFTGANLNFCTSSATLTNSRHLDPIYIASPPASAADISLLANATPATDFSSGGAVFRTSGSQGTAQTVSICDADTGDQTTPCMRMRIGSANLQFLNHAGNAVEATLTQTGSLNTPVFVRSAIVAGDQGSACTNGELTLSAGWQSTGSATVTAVAGNGQTCSWTITTGTTTAANPTVTDTLTNGLPNATMRCWMFLEYGPASTHTAAVGEGFAQTTLSATAPVFTFNGTPTAAGKTYLVVRTCGP